MKNFHDEPDYRRLFVAIFLAAVLMFAWQALVEWPRRKALADYHVKQQEQTAKAQKDYAQQAALNVPASAAEENPAMPRKDRIALSPRLPIRSGTLDGSLSLKGARLDDLSLVKYRVTVDPNSPEVTLFSPNGDPQSYFAQVGWVATDKTTKVPSQDSVWEADKKEITPGNPVTLSWNNGEGQNFFLTYTLDANYMFAISQRVENHSPRQIRVAPYAFINRTHDTSLQKPNVILHEGPLGVLENNLQEIGYDTLRDKGNKSFENASGWLGITDKYWLSAIIPTQGGFKATFSHYQKNGHARYQADYLGQSETIEPGAASTQSLRFFAGAKQLKLIDRYAEGDAAHGFPPIPLFDRAVDLGVLYFLTKPMFLLLNALYEWTGNFGVAILLLTVLVKLAMYKLATKSYVSMARMREMQPEMLKVRERYSDDQMQMQKEMMALYKREKINPASGCLPLLIQMPVFFALYKVLYVTIEMRHAPFLGWITDLSVQDPSNVFTLFGLIPWTPPGFLHLGILPILMCASMIIQMRQQPMPPDPVQAKVIKFMPYFMLVIFATFPAGLVLYWVWSNILSIIQQYIIAKRHGKKPAAKHETV